MFILPSGRESVIIPGPGKIVIENVLALLIPAESVTLKVTVMALVAMVGVPVMVPVEGFRDSPIGIPDTVDQIYSGVPPEAANV